MRIIRGLKSERSKKVLMVRLATGALIAGAVWTVNNLVLAKLSGLTLLSAIAITSLIAGFLVVIGMMGEVMVEVTPIVKTAKAREIAKRSSQKN